MPQQPNGRADFSQRVAIQSAIALSADEQIQAFDPALMPDTPDQWVTMLVASLGCVACADQGEDLTAYLVEHMAAGLLWLEARVREEAA